MKDKSRAINHISIFEDYLIRICRGTRLKVFILSISKSMENTVPEFYITILLSRYKKDDYLSMQNY